jgi:hypothetical protein
MKTKIRDEQNVSAEIPFFAAIRNKQFAVKKVKANAGLLFPGYVFFPLS